jgi:hypothetical protein
MSKIDEIKEELSKFRGEVESRGNKKHASLLADSLSLLLKGALRHITHKEGRTYEL